jgi:hypothetical protein
MCGRVNGDLSFHQKSEKLDDAKMVVELMPSCKEPIGKEPYRSTKIDTIIFDPLAARAIVVDSP